VSGKYNKNSQEITRFLIHHLAFFDKPKPLLKTIWVKIIAIANQKVGVGKPQQLSMLQRLWRRQTQSVT